MANNTPSRATGRTIVVAATATVSETSLGSSATVQRTIEVYNGGNSPVFVTTGAASGTLVFPTTSVAQNGTIVPPGANLTITKNAMEDTTAYSICATGQSTTLYIKSSGGR